MGTRKTIYINDSNKWLIGAIKALLKESDQLGIRCTESDIVVAALEQYLHKYKGVKIQKKENKVKQTGLKRTVMCPVSKGWLFDRIDELVQLKQAVGVKASFSHELCNLAAASLTASQGLGKIARETLSNFKSI